MRRFIILAGCIFLLSGCASGIMITKDEKPEIKAKDDIATLVIIRDSWLGNAVAFWHYIDSKLIGETTGKTYFITNVKPGQHYIMVATENVCTADIDFQPGKIYFLREGVIMGIWRARTSGFEPYTHQQAMDAIHDCSYTELDTNKPSEDMDPQLYKQAIDDYKEEVKQNPEGYKAMLEYKGE
jgi:hypothetical protein